MLLFPRPRSSCLGEGFTFWGSWLPPGGAVLSGLWAAVLFSCSSHPHMKFHMIASKSRPCFMVYPCSWLQLILQPTHAFSQLVELAEAHIDATGGGPPCSTVSRARFNRRVAGPRLAQLFLGKKWFVQLGTPVEWRRPMNCTSTTWLWMRRFPPEAAHTGLNILLIRVVIRIPACGTLQRCKSQNVGQRQWRQTFINVFLVPGAEGHDLRNPLAQDVSAQINHQRFYVIGQGTVSFTFHKFWATCRELFLLTGCWTCRCWKDLLPWKLGAFLAGGFSYFFKSISWWFVCRGLIPSQVLSYLQRTASLTRFTGTWFGKKDLLTWKLGAFLAVWFFAIKFELRGFYLIDRSGKFSLL